MINKKFWMALEAIMLIAWIVITILFVSYVFNSGTKCLANPLRFGTNQLQNQNNDTFFSCKCTFENDLSKYVYIDKNTYEWRANNVLNGG
jgi:hypothetical protein